jgi:membrane protease YdiL (CAAX protease family)
MPLADENNSLESGSFERRSIERGSFWGFEDLALFLGAILPAFVGGMILVRVGRAIAPGAFSSEAVQTLVFQSAIYLVLAGALYVLTAVRYGRPMWRSLGWTLRFRGAWWYLGGAPVLAVAISAAGVLLRAPDLPTPVESLITSRGSLAAVLLFAAFFGPLFEELVFRGFLYPLLATNLGPWLGIALAALAFALLHGPEYQWSWQHVLLVGAAGVAFGFARYHTGSTAAAALLHIGYNATYVVGFLIERRA